MKKKIIMDLLLLVIPFIPTKKLFIVEANNLVQCCLQDEWKKRVIHDFNKQYKKKVKNYAQKWLVLKSRAKMNILKKHVFRLREVQSINCFREAVGLEPNQSEEQKLKPLVDEYNNLKKFIDQQ